MFKLFSIWEEVEICTITIKADKKRSRDLERIENIIELCSTPVHYIDGDDLYVSFDTEMSIKEVKYLIEQKLHGIETYVFNEQIIIITEKKYENVEERLTQFDYLIKEPYCAAPSMVYRLIELEEKLIKMDKHPNDYYFKDIEKTKNEKTHILELVK